MTTPPINQADREAWDTYAPEIEFGTMTGPELLALVRAQARDAALEEVNRCARCRAYNSTTNTTGEG